MVNVPVTVQVDFASDVDRGALPSVDVIIPVYNVEGYLERCVSSVLGQEGVEPNVVLVDDGSTDGSPELCDTLASAHRGVSVIHTENQGVSAARNAGLEFCRGAYVAFVDPDDYLSPGTLAGLLSSLESKQADISFCDIFREWDDGMISPLRQNVPDALIGEKVVEAYLSGSLFTGIPGKLFRRKTIGSARFSPLAMSEDALFLIRLAVDSDLVVVYCSSGSYRYWQRSGSVRLSAFNDRQLGSLECADEVEALVRERRSRLSRQASAFSFAYHIGTLSRLYAWDAAEGREELVFRLVESLRKHAPVVRGYVASSKLLAWRLYQVSPRLFAVFARKYYSRTLYRGLGA